MPFMEVIFPPQRAGMGEEIQERVDRKHKNMPLIYRKS